MPWKKLQGAANARYGSRNILLNAGDDAAPVPGISKRRSKLQRGVAGYARIMRAAMGVRAHGFAEQRPRAPRVHRADRGSQQTGEHPNSLYR
jgi:hypothetical protein